jgi:hypothetical protein
MGRANDMKQLSRRAVLRGFGTALSLPFLEAMLPAKRSFAASDAPLRFLGYYVPCGIHMRSWTPQAEGAGYALSPILEPLAPVKEKVLILTGLANRPARPDGPGDHASGTGAFLTVAHPYKTDGSDIRNGVSVDQTYAQAIQGTTRFSSLQLGTDGGGNTGGCDSGYTCAYARNISWANASTPLAKEVNPQAAFDRLMSSQPNDPQAIEARRKQRLYRLSVLDYVADSARQLDARLGRDDRQKLDQYLTGVRELEVQVSNLDTGSVCSGNRPGSNSEFPALVRSMLDVMVLAFQCDMTRSITFMQGNAGSNRSYGFLGVPDGHHGLSHHQGNPENFRKLEIINRWEVEQLAYLLSRLDGISEGDGTLLDSSIVFFSSEIEDGDSHSHFNMPIVVAGTACGRIRSGRHARYPNQDTVGNLFVSLLNALGTPASRFGDDGTGPLAGILV